MLRRLKSGRGCALGRGEYQPGDMLASSPGTSGIKMISTEQKMKIDPRFFLIGFGRDSIRK
jgi:hypothetical protein